jgi:hypothetical protein
MWDLRAGASATATGAMIAAGAPWAVVAVAALAAASAAAVGVATRLARGQVTTEPRAVVPFTRPSAQAFPTTGIWADETAVTGVISWVAVPAGLIAWLTGDLTVLVGLACVAHAAATVPTLLAGWVGGAPVRSEAGQLLTALLALFSAAAPQLVVWLFPAYLAAAAVLALTVATLTRLHPTSTTAPPPALAEQTPIPAPIPAAARWRRALAPAATLVAWLVLTGWLVASTPSSPDLHSAAAAPAPVTGSGLVATAVRPVAVAASPDEARLAEAHFDRDEVAIIDRATGAVTASVRVGDGPQHLAWTPDGRHVVTVDVLSQEVSVVDVERGALVASHPVPSPVAVAMDPAGMAYIASSDPAQVTRIDPDPDEQDPGQGLGQVGRPGDAPDVIGSGVGGGGVDSGAPRAGDTRTGVSDLTGAGQAGAPR